MGVMAYTVAGNHPPVKTVEHPRGGGDPRVPAGWIRYVASVNRGRTDDRNNLRRIKRCHTFAALTYHPPGACDTSIS